MEELAHQTYFKLENNKKRQLTYSVIESKAFNYHESEI